MKEKVSNKTFEDIVKPYIEESKKEEAKKQLVKDINELRSLYITMTLVTGDPVLAALIMFCM